MPRDRIGCEFYGSPELNALGKFLEGCSELGVIEAIVPTSRATSLVISVVSGSELLSDIGVASGL